MVVTEIVVGLPIQLDGQEGRSTINGQLVLVWRNRMDWLPR